MSLFYWSSLTAVKEAFPPTFPSELSRLFLIRIGSSRDVKKMSLSLRECGIDIMEIGEIKILAS